MGSKQKLAQLQITNHWLNLKLQERSPKILLNGDRYQSTGSA
jgi:hypothetical protein